MVRKNILLDKINVFDAYSIACLLTCNCAIIDAQKFASRRNSVKEEEC